MKIYFDGCSWTRGAELQNPEEERYSKLLCNELGAEETNLAVSGGSNDRIVRNLLVENNIEDYEYESKKSVLVKNKIFLVKLDFHLVLFYTDLPNEKNTTTLSEFFLAPFISKPIFLKFMFLG